MKNRVSLALVTMVFLSFGCEAKRPGILLDLLSSEDHDWLDRDAQEDKFEMPDGQCCNDYIPYALPLDTTINAVINPDNDLDYFYVNLLDNSLGYLAIRTDDSDVRLRLFTLASVDGNDEIAAEIDSITNTVGADETTSLGWTFITARNEQLRVLVQGGGSDSPLFYQLLWQRIVPTVGLDLLLPGTATTWELGVEQRISWSSSLDGGITVALADEHAMITVLKRDVRDAELNWTPELSLTPGVYKIVIYLTDDPKVVEVSDVVTIQ